MLVRRFATTGRIVGATYDAAAQGGVPAGFILSDGRERLQWPNDPTCHSVNGLYYVRKNIAIKVSRGHFYTSLRQKPHIKVDTEVGVLVWSRTIAIAIAMQLGACHLYGRA